MTATQNGRRPRLAKGPDHPGDAYPRDPYPTLDVEEAPAPPPPVEPDVNADDSGRPARPMMYEVVPKWARSSEGIRRNVRHVVPVAVNRAAFWGFKRGYAVRPFGWAARGAVLAALELVRFAFDTETRGMRKAAAARGDGRARAYERKEIHKSRRHRVLGTVGWLAGVGVLGAVLTGPAVPLPVRVLLWFGVLGVLAAVGYPRDREPGVPPPEDRDPATSVVRSDRVVTTFADAGIKEVMTIGGTSRRTRDPEGWEAVVDLPKGATVAEAHKAHESLCSAWRIPKERLYLRRGAHEGQVLMTLFDEDPMTGAPQRTPLRDLEVRDLFDPVPIGTTVYGDPYGLVLPGTSGTWICSAPGYGKTNLLQLLVAFGVLHPRAVLYIHDGKGEGDLDVFADLAVHYSYGSSKAAGQECASMLGKVLALRDERREAMRRLRVDRPDVMPSSQITSAAVADPAFGLPLVFVIVDELNDLVGTSSGDLIQERLQPVAQSGRSGGIVPIIAGQRFDAKVLDGTQSSMGTRIAFRTNSPQDSNTVLGQGQVSEGFNTARWPDNYQGVCIVRPGGVQVHRGTQQIKTHLGELEEHRAIAARAARIRKAAGAQTGQATATVGLLDRVLHAVGAENVVAIDEVADRLGMDVEVLVGQLRDARVPVEPSRKHGNRRAVRRRDITDRLM